MPDEKNELMTTKDVQREWPDDRQIDNSIFSLHVIGKEPRVHKTDLVQFRGRFIKGYLHASCPNTSPPDYYQEQDWLDEDCSVILSNHLLKEKPEHVLGLFQHDELGLDDWAKERIAKAIWQNLAWRKKLPNEVSGSDRLWQIWQQECERHFPEDARLTIRQKYEARLNGDGAHSTME